MNNNDIANLISIVENQERISNITHDLIRLL